MVALSCPDEAALVLADLRRAQATEAGHAAVNIHLLEAEWRQRMRDAKLKELFVEASELDTLRGRKYKLRACSLKDLSQECKDVQAQFGAAEAAHKQLIASIVAQFENELGEMHDRAVRQVQAIHKNVAEECTAAATVHTELCRRAGEDIATLHEEHTGALNRLTAMVSAQKQALRDLWDERCGVTRLLGEERLQALASASHSETKAFTGETRDERVKHDALLKEDAQDSATAEAQAQQLDAVQKDVEGWRERLAKDAMQWQRQVAEAKSTKGAALAKHATLQRETGLERKKHEQRLKALSLER